MPYDVTREKTRMLKAIVLRQSAPSVAPRKSERRRSLRQVMNAQKKCATVKKEIGQEYIAIEKEFQMHPH